MKKRLLKIIITLFFFVSLVHFKVTVLVKDDYLGLLRVLAADSPFHGSSCAAVFSSQNLLSRHSSLFLRLVEEHTPALHL